MTLSEQCAILVEAIEEELLQPDDIIRWADNIIVDMDKPPMWIIEISTLQSPLMIDFETRLRTQASGPLPMSRRLQLIALAQNAGLLSLPATLPRLYRITIGPRPRPPITDPLGRRLVDALYDWDEQDDLDVIEPLLQAKFTALFQQYLKNTDDIVAILPWKFAKAA